MLDLSVESDVAGVEDELKELGLYIPNIARKILKRLTAKGRSKLKKAYGQIGIHEGSGEAKYKGTREYVHLRDALFASAKDLYVGYFGRGEQGKIQVHPLNYGAELRPSRGEYLTFRDASGNWHKVKSVHIAAHNFFAAATDYVGSAEYENDIDTVVSREVNKMFTA